MIVSGARVATGLLLLSAAAGCPRGAQPGGTWDPAPPEPSGFAEADPEGIRTGQGADPAASGAGATGLEAKGRFTSSLFVRVVWPTFRGVQMLPLSTRTLQVVVRDPAGAVVGELALARTAGESSGQIERLPSGPAKVRVEALDSANGVVATGERDVTLLPNKRTTLDLELLPARQPSISAISPLAGGPGIQVTVTGSNFPAGSSADIAVRVGGLTVGGAAVQIFGGDSLAFIVPAGATTGPVVVSVDGLSTASAPIFTTVGSVSLTPVSGLPLATGSSRTFTIRAFDTAATPSPVPGALIAWSLGPAGGGGFGFGSVLPGTLSPLEGTTDASGVATCSFLATATGSAVVTGRSGTVSATAAVEVN